MKEKKHRLGALRYQVQLNLTVPLWEGLKEAAFVDGHTPSEIVRNLVNNFLIDRTNRTLRKAVGQHEQSAAG
jgi:hypothetical protein